MKKMFQYWFISIVIVPVIDPVFGQTKTALSFRLNQLTNAYDRFLTVHVIVYQ